MAGTSVRAASSNRVVSLEDPAALGSADRGGMLELIAGLGGQLLRGFDIAASTPALPSGEGVRAVVLSGMGGSGIGGDLVRAAFGSAVTTPVVVSKGYDLPGFCDHDTLVVATSFSGNTEETVAAYRRAVATGCRVITVSTGGELAALSEADGTPHIPVPSDVTLPRAALGYLGAAVVAILGAVGLLAEARSHVEAAAHALDRLAARVGAGEPVGSNEAKAVAAWIGDRVPVVWGSLGVAEAAAMRWKTQFNENAKTPAFASALPELDHNEIEGWSEGSGEGFAVIALRHEGEHPRVAARVEATRELLAGSGLSFREVRAGEEASPLATAFSLVMLGDFVSTYVALARGVDPSPIPVLSALKDRLRG